MCSAILPSVLGLGACVNTTFDSPYYTYYFDEYVPTFTEGFGVPHSLSKNVMYIGDRENMDAMELFATYVRNPDANTWTTYFSYPPMNATLNTVLYIESVGLDVAVIVTDNVTYVQRDLHVYQFNATLGQPVFVQNLVHSACADRTFGSSVSQNIAHHRLAIGSNIVAATCTRFNSSDSIVVFWMRHYNGTWVEGTTVVDIDPSCTLSAQLHMINTGYYILVSEPDLKQVHMYKRSPYNNLELVHFTTIYGPSGSMKFGSSMTCRNHFVGQTSSILRDLCIVCDIDYNGGSGACWIYKNMDVLPVLVDNPLVQSPSIDTVAFGTSVAFVDAVGQQLIVAISDGGTYSCYLTAIGACRTVRAYEFDYMAEQMTLIGDIEDPLTGPDINFFGLAMSGSYGTYEGYLTVSAVAFTYYPYYDANNRVYVYSILDQDCCGTSGAGADNNATVDACTLIDCLTDTTSSVDTDDFNECTTDSCSSYTGDVHDPVGVTTYCTSDITCTSSNLCGEYGWCIANITNNCPEYPTECRSFCDEDYLFYPVCGIYDHAFGLACSYGECNGFGECVSTMCDIDDTCRGISCHESRARVYNSLSAYSFTLNQCLNMYGVSGNAMRLDEDILLQIDYVLDTKKVKEWVAEARSLFHRYDHSCDPSCAFWTDTMYPSLKRSYQIMFELVDALGCTDAHSLGINDLECMPHGDGELRDALRFEDLLDASSVFPDIDMNDVIVEIRLCVFRAHETNITAGMWIETEPVAKGSWDSHVVEITLNGNLTQKYPGVTYVHPDKYFDELSYATTRAFAQNKEPTAHGWNDMGDCIVTLVNSTASVLQNPSVLHPARHDRIVNTLNQPTRCAAFSTETNIIPYISTTCPLLPLSKLPVYAVAAVNVNRTAVVALPSWNGDPALNKADFSAAHGYFPSGVFINGTCFNYWSYERVEVNVSHPLFNNFHDYVVNGGSCGIGCADWYTYAPDLSKLFQDSLEINKWGDCYV